MVVTFIGVDCLVVGASAHLCVNFRMTLMAETHKIRRIVCAAISQRLNVMHLLDRNVTSSLHAPFTEWVHMDIGFSGCLPVPTVTFAVMGIPSVLFILPTDKMTVFLTISVACQSRASRIGTQPLCFMCHRNRPLRFSQGTRDFSQRLCI